MGGLAPKHREEEDVDERDDPWASRHDCLGDEEEGGEAEMMVRFDLRGAASFDSGECIHGGGGWQGAS